MWHNSKCFAEMQIDEICHISFVYKIKFLLKNIYKFSLTQSALEKFTLNIIPFSNYLHVCNYSFLQIKKPEKLQRILNVYI